MSKVFFTGCTHFDHANIISLADRPFGSVKEMNDVLVQNWNSVVKPNDEVFHLGDFAWDGEGEGNERVAEYWNGKLNGRKYLIIGNHDDFDWVDHRHGEYGFRGIGNYLDLKRAGKHFILFHYPMEDWDGRYRGSIHLHCHTHQKVLERPLLPYVENSGLTMESDTNLVLPARYPEGQYCNRFNVTVEATKYTPISLDEIVARSMYKGPE